MPKRKRITIAEAVVQARETAIRSAQKDDPHDYGIWGCPRCDLYLIKTLDGQHWTCVSGQDHGVYVLWRGTRTEVRVERRPELPA